MSNVLIVGNGFDLAHGLPTKYSDYLKQLERSSDFYDHVNSEYHEPDWQELDDLIDSVVCYHLTTKMNENKGWIDFELEIKEIVESVASIENIFVRKLDINTKKYYYIVSKDTLENIPIFLLRYIYRDGKQQLRWEQEELKTLKEEVLKHIKLFISFFEKYLTWLFDSVQPITPIPFFEKMSVDYFLSFNYTPTFEILYKNRYKIFGDENICFVHGIIENTGKIVMGIGSEFYDENIHEDYVELFKFYQRYEYDTDYNYQEWIPLLSKERTLSFDNSNSEKNSKKHTIIIYGHSIDPTDRDILYPFLSLDNVKVKIYYYGKDAKLQIEKNLLKILKRELFEKYLIGNEKKIYLIDSTKTVK